MMRYIYKICCLYIYIKEIRLTKQKVRDFRAVKDEIIFGLIVYIYEYKHRRIKMFFFIKIVIKIIKK